MRVRFTFVMFLLVGFISTVAPGSCWGTPPQETKERLLDLKDFNTFLEDHPAILPDLKRDPSLITNPQYLEQHPDLKSFLAARPHLEASFISALSDRHCDKPAPEIYDKVSPRLCSSTPHPSIHIRSRIA
jgi:hypothetical protein